MRNPTATIPARIPGPSTGSFGAILSLFRALFCQSQPLFGGYLGQIKHKAKGLDQ